jgi:murein L,D-transpeptidase YcbB/YkuD
MGITYTYNRMYKRPIFPVGQTYMDPPARDLMRFRALAQSYGTAPSWWSWQETRRSEWQTLAQPLPGPVKGYDPVDTHPTVKRGYRGDSIVWLQQHLIGAGLRVPATGIFGKQTYRAVRRFQDDRNLRVDGVVGNRTWNRLLRVKPVRVKWSAPRAASARTSGTPAPRAPISATIPPVRNEIAGAR